MIDGYQTVGCSHCAAVHLAPAGASGTCPGCGVGAVAATEARIDGSPERVAARAVDRESAVAALARFVGETPFPTAELDPPLLASRLVSVWLPRWLVDATVGGAWEAEAGFDYAVQSTQEVLEGGSWRSREVTETRVRWEPRVGRVQRSYDNVVVAGLADRALDSEPTTDLAPWSPQVLEDGWVRLPDRARAEAWPEAEEQLRALVAEDCQRACEAQHVRDVYVELDAEQTAWTWLLVPTWVSWYADDEGGRHLLQVHGGTGRASGPRRASPARGRQWALGLLTAAALAGGTGLVIGLIGVVLWPLLALAGFLLLVALGLGVGALWPWLRPAAWNQRPENGAHG